MTAPTQSRQYGKISRVDGVPQVEFERHLQAPTEVVCDLVTSPEHLALWLQANATLEPRVGGRVVLEFKNSEWTDRGTILQFDAPSTLEYTWRGTPEQDSAVRFELKTDETGDSTILRLTHRFFTKTKTEEFAAGWHQHLDLLEEQVTGRPVAWSDDRFQVLRSGYSSKEAGDS